MIVFDLRCPKGHVFEGWFRDGAAFDEQKAAGDLVCPVCGSHKVGKAPMAPRISTGARGDDGDAPARAAERTGTERSGSARSGSARQTFATAPAAGLPAAMAAAMTALRELHREVEKSCDYVGDRFAEEARKIHYGEAESRGIYGEATAEEARALVEEGIDVHALPRLPRGDA